MLQVKNLPPDLHAALAARAHDEGVSMSEYVTRLLRSDLSRPTMSEWLARHRDAQPAREIDVLGALDADRADSDSPTTSARR